MKNAGFSTRYILVLDFSLISFFIPKNLNDYLWRLINLGGFYEDIIGFLVAKIYSRLPRDIRYEGIPEWAASTLDWITILGLVFILFLLFAKPHKKLPKATEVMQ